MPYEAYVVSRTSTRPQVDSAPDGAGAVVCAPEHVAALEKVVLANFADRPPCRRKHRRPPTAAALAEADRIRGAIDAVEGQQVVADFARYAAATRPIRAHGGAAH